MTSLVQAGKGDREIATGVCIQLYAVLYVGVPSELK